MINDDDDELAMSASHFAGCSSNHERRKLYEYEARLRAHEMRYYRLYASCGDSMDTLLRDKHVVECLVAYANLARSSVSSIDGLNAYRYWRRAAANILARLHLENGGPLNYDFDELEWNLALDRWRSDRSVWFDCNNFMMFGKTRTEIRATDDEMNVICSRMDEVGRSTERH